MKAALECPYRIEQATFRGHPYRYVALDRPPEWPGWKDPSWWSFHDETHVRNAFWDIQPGDQVFDIGAAYGTYAVTALACGAGEVFAWSPQGHPGSPDTEADCFRATLALNGWEDRCHIYEEGLYSRRGWLDARTQEFFTEEPPKNPDIIAVRPFGQWLEQEFHGKGHVFAPRVWAKLDIEGAEVEVLKDLLDPLIRPATPRLLIENHNFKRAAIEAEVRELATSWGYREVQTIPYGPITHSFYVAE